MKTASVVKGARKRLGLTQLELAQKLGVTSIAISRWERGVVIPPKPTLRLLATLDQQVEKLRGDPLRDYYAVRLLESAGYFRQPDGSYIKETRKGGKR